MRLLNTTTIELEEFIESNTPEYAILSHTWGKEEVTLQDLQTPHGRRKSGYEKIKKTCEMALKNGYRYAWIDTCTIDKTSSAELSEAINSMFRWYQQAAVCYSYLSDVVIDHVDVNSHALELQLSKSKWFTRGWTLQELIAPSKIVFFAADWAQLGQRDELSGLISRITGIAESFLHSRDMDINQLLSQASIAERMSWASARETTRTEDMAYSLLGIFEVNMPLLYGEGSERAFIRLQTEIARFSSDQSIFAWHYTTRTPNGAPCGIFATSPRAFSQSGDVVPFDAGSSIPSFSVTNRGLHITMPMYNQNGLLQCRHKDDFTTMIVAPLRKISDNLYARDPDLLGKVDYRAWRRWSQERIYVATDLMHTQERPQDSFFIRCLARDYSLPKLSKKRVHTLKNLKALRPGEEDQIHDISILKKGKRIAFLTLSIFNSSASNSDLSTFSPTFRASHYFTFERNPNTGQLPSTNVPKGNRFSVVRLPEGVLYVKIRPKIIFGARVFFVDVMFSSNKFALLWIWVTTMLHGTYCRGMLYVIKCFPRTNWTWLEAGCGLTFEVTIQLIVMAFFTSLPPCILLVLDGLAKNSWVSSILTRLARWLPLENYYVSQGLRLGLGYLLPGWLVSNEYMGRRYQIYYARPRGLEGIDLFVVDNYFSLGTPFSLSPLVQVLTGSSAGYFLFFIVLLCGLPMCLSMILRALLEEIKYHFLVGEIQGYGTAKQLE